MIFWETGHRGLMPELFESKGSAFFLLSSIQTGWGDLLCVRPQFEHNLIGTETLLSR